MKNIPNMVALHRIANRLGETYVLDLNAQVYKPIQWSNFFLIDDL